MSNPPPPKYATFSDDAQDPGKAHTIHPKAPSAEQMPELERLLSLTEVQAVRSGIPFPLGANLRGDGFNFAIISRHATGVRLDLFDHREGAKPVRSIILDEARNKTSDIWHVWPEGIRSSQLSGYRIAGPYAPHKGHCSNPNKLVVEPCATANLLLADSNFQEALGCNISSPQNDLSFSDFDNAATAPKYVVTLDHFNWQGDQPIRHPWTSIVLYELQVRGYTLHVSAGSPIGIRLCPGFSFELNWSRKEAF